tara:strand:- start:154 stop:348 length:195 start_codon:yes stop_codon:yes gene_type:complete
MLEKELILIVILGLLLLFYFVIRFGAGKKEAISKSKEVSRYLIGVRALISILALVGVILWFFME